MHTEEEVVVPGVGWGSLAAKAWDMGWEGEGMCFISVGILVASFLLVTLSFGSSFFSEGAAAFVGLFFGSSLLNWGLGTFSSD